MYWSACLTLLLLSTCSAGLLRVPKVYNAIINSNDNLTPSRAFPLIQPVIQETALGYPLSPVVYVPEKQSAQQSDNARQSEPPTFEVKIPPPDDIKNESPKQDQPKNQQPKDNVPIKLNEFGIPPSLVPVQNYLPKVAYPYDPYANYNPYFTDPYTGLILPYSNPYNPYYPSPFAQNPFSPYSLLHPSFYGLQQTGPWSNPNWFPGRVPQQESAEPQLQPQPQPQLQPQPRPQLRPQPQPQPQLQPRPQPRPQPQPQQQTQPIKPDQIGYPPADLNVKNNANKNSNIPDVPPPPLPVGGLKYDNKKSSS